MAFRGSRLESWMAIGGVVFSGCERAPPNERGASSDEKPSTVATTLAPPSSVSRAATSSTAQRSEVRDAGSPRLLPLLDEEKGRQAAQAYVRDLEPYCVQPRLPRTAESPPAKSGAPRSPGVNQSHGRRTGGVPPGFPSDAKLEAVCRESDSAKPLASGGLHRSGEDEVLLEIPSGHENGGKRALAVMRADNGRCRLVEQGLAGKRFEARARFGGLTERDQFLVCQVFGDTRASPRRCGFLGFGTFQLGSLTSADLWNVVADELELIEIGTPGDPGTYLRVGEARATTRGLSIELFVESEKTGLEKFDIDYEWREGRPVRLTGIPVRIARKLERRGVK